MRNQILSATAALKLLFRERAIQANMLIVMALMLCIFVIDLNTPLGVAAAVPYVLVVFASLWVSGIRFTYLIAIFSLILTITGFYLSPGIVMPMNIVV
ncbi:MAG: GGDEF domain-containing protein, partial [Betaproteobacteria bacterium]|nr:GGDEF domain-containing protein [Betaproteobacteria bacterium]